MSKIVRVPIEKEVERWLVLPDIHVPTEDRQALNAVLSYVGENNYDGFIQLGDWADFGTISSHNKGVLGKVENQRIQSDFDALDNSIKEIAGILGKKCKKFFIQGNHEFRLNRYLDEHTELKTVPEFNLEKRIKKVCPEMVWIPYWEKGVILKVGKGKFGHGRHVGGYHAAKNCRDYNGNFFSGHTHDVMYISETTYDDNETRGAMSLGCLQRKKVEWMQGRPNKWQLAFGEFFFQKNGTFTFYVPQIFNSSFVAPTGKVYKG